MIAVTIFRIDDTGTAENVHLDVEPQVGDVLSLEIATRNLRGNFQVVRRKLTNVRADGESGGARQVKVLVRKAITLAEGAAAAGLCTCAPGSAERCTRPGCVNGGMSVRGAEE